MARLTIYTALAAAAGGAAMAWCFQAARLGAELSRWTYAGGKQLPGLVNRRKAERELCERGVQ